MRIIFRDHATTMMQDAIDQLRKRVTALGLPRRRIAAASGCDEKTIRNFIAGRWIAPQTFEGLWSAMPDLEKQVASRKDAAA